ncbi:MAG: HAD-IB family hydrolase [Slackia sp.]|nr:HAD-IB family hydrolase [Slackia sp.]
MSEQAKHKIAAFDFDGTSIRGNSPVILVRHLRRCGMLRKRVISKVLAWAAAYKLRLPQSEAWVRGQVFTAFAGRPKEDVDEFLASFYEAEIEGAGRFRPQADAAMRRLHDEGVEVLIVSATFGPIVRRAQAFHPFDGCLCTEMRVDDQGRYTTHVDGTCVEGEEKVRAIRAYADARYGAGNWELVEAYGDHHSDTPMLAAATRGFAVTPDNPLAREARRRGWAVLDWDESVEK